jgi:hypothetical protein
MTRAILVVFVLAVAMGALWWRGRRGRAPTIANSSHGTSNDLAAIDTVAIFDNNVYRDLTTGLNSTIVDKPIRALIAAERQQRIRGLMHPVVAMELAARLAEHEPSTQARVRAALTAMALHCSIARNGHNAIGFVADPDSSIARHLFGHELDNNRRVSQMLAKLCVHVAARRDKPLEPTVEAFAEEIARHVAATEASFVDDMLAYVAKPFNHAIATWDDVVARPELAKPALAFLRSSESREIFARTYVAKVAAQANALPPATGTGSAVDWFVNSFGLGISLYNEIVSRILLSGCRLSKRNRENWFWDLHLALSAGATHSVLGRAVVLVTSDRDVCDAAKAIGASHTVLSLPEYRLRLGI